MIHIKMFWVQHILNSLANWIFGHVVVSLYHVVCLVAIVVPTFFITRQWDKEDFQLLDTKTINIFMHFMHFNYLLFTRGIFRGQLSWQLCRHIHQFCEISVETWEEERVFWENGAILLQTWLFIHQSRFTRRGKKLFLCFAMNVLLTLLLSYWIE